MPIRSCVQIIEETLPALMVGTHTDKAGQLEARDRRVPSGCAGQGDNQMRSRSALRVANDDSQSVEGFFIWASPVSG
jgi:hypothetical protein